MSQPTRIFLAGIASGLTLCMTVPAQNSPGVAGSGYGWTGDPSPIAWESTYTKTPPVIDGVFEDVWKRTKPVTVLVREAMGGDHPKPVVLRAMHTDDSLFIAAEWPDATKSDMRDPYIWNPQTKKYDRPSKPDDQFAIEFPIKGDFGISMLTVTREFTADVWHWKAGRGNPIGWVDDKYHVISQKPLPEAKKHDLHGGRSVYIARLQDAGTPSFKLKPEAQTHQGDLVDSFDQQEPSGSLGDVRGKGVHNGKTWLLEMGRKFNTGHPEDDAAIDPGKDNVCAIAVLNDELYEEHSVSTVILLRFRGGPRKAK